MGDPAQHAKLSPSGAHRWMNCPSSVHLSQGIADHDSPAAAEGTFAHDVAALCLERGVDATKLVGHSDGTYDFDADMAAHVQVYLDAVRGVGLANGFNTTAVDIERRVHLRGITDQVYGTADALVFSRDRLDVFDLKFGAGVWVPIVGNVQLRIYGLGALLTFGATAKAKTIAMHIVQPRFFAGGAKWRTELLGVDDLKAWGEQVLRPAIAKVGQADAFSDLAAGTWCRFCPAKAQCPALRDKALTAASAVFEDCTKSLAPAKTAPNPVHIPAAELGKALDAFPMVETWMKAVREEAYTRARGGTRIPGHKLVQKTGNRAWTDEKGAAAMLEGLGVAPYVEPKLVSPAQAEKLLGSKRKKRVAPYVFKPTRGTALVSDSDNRNALLPGDAFDSIP